MTKYADANIMGNVQLQYKMAAIFIYVSDSYACVDHVSAQRHCWCVLTFKYWPKTAAKQQDPF